jgi:hypothetical protein
MNPIENILETFQREYFELVRERFEGKLDAATFEEEMSKIKMTAYDLLSHSGISREEAFDRIVRAEEKCQAEIVEKDEPQNGQDLKKAGPNRTWMTGESAIYFLQMR